MLSKITIISINNFISEGKNWLMSVIKICQSIIGFILLCLVIKYVDEDNLLIYYASSQVFVAILILVIMMIFYTFNKHTVIK